MFKTGWSTVRCLHKIGASPRSTRGVGRHEGLFWIKPREGGAQLKSSASILRVHHNLGGTASLWRKKEKCVSPLRSCGANGPLLPPHLPLPR